MQTVFTDKWEPITEMTNFNIPNPNFIHCDTRDFSYTYNNEVADTIEQIIHKYPKDVYKNAYIHYTMIVPYLLNIKKQLRKNKQIMLRFNVPNDINNWYNGWLKYIRFVYMENGYYCMYTMCGDTVYILPVDIYNVDNIKKDY